MIRSGDRTCNKWRSAWATMDEQCIRFYDNDSVPSVNGGGSLPETLMSALAKSITSMECLFVIYG